MPFSDAAKSVLSSKTFYFGLLGIVNGVVTIVAGREIDVPSMVGMTPDQISTLGMTLGPLLFGVGSTAIISGVGTIYGRIMAHRPVTVPGVRRPPPDPSAVATARGRLDAAIAAIDAAKPAAEDRRERPDATSAGAAPIEGNRTAVPPPETKARALDQLAMTAQRERVKAAIGAIDPDKEKRADEVMERSGLRPSARSPFSGHFSVSVVIVAASALAGCAVPAALSPQSVAELAAACSAFDDALDEATAAALAGRLTGPALMRAGALKQEATARCQVPTSMSPADVAAVRADAQRLRSLLPAPAP